MNGGLNITFDLLAKIQNEAAVAVLVPALDAVQSEIAQGALQALLKRRSHAGAEELIRRLHTVDHACNVVVEHRLGHMTGALRKALTDTDEQTRVNAFDAVLWLREYDLLPVLIRIAEDAMHPHRVRAAQTILALAELLYEELGQPRDYTIRRDPHVVRQHAINSLEGSIIKYPKHQSLEIIEAFLLLVNRENVTLQMILMDPLHGSYRPVIELLSQSTKGGVIRLVLSFLDDQHAPSAAIALLSKRADNKFIEHLLKKIGSDPSPAVLHNLKRADSIPWLQGSPELLDHLNDCGQAAAVQVAVGSGIHRLIVFSIIEHLLARGKDGGRKAAAEALADFNGAEANALALHALNDANPDVQAAAYAQLRRRAIPGSITRLIEAVNSPYEVVRKAACESLNEFSFRRYVSAYDKLDEEVRRSTGVLVKKIDSEALALLEEELQSSANARRLRGVSMAIAMEACRELESQMILMLADENHLIRAEAARALANCNSARSRDALRQAMLDRSVVVQKTAEQSLILLDHPDANWTEVALPV